MARLFGRVARLTVVQRPTIQPSSTKPGYFDRVGTTLEIDRLRMQFESKRTLGKEPNTLTVKVFNLAETTRTSLEKGTLGASFFAGYDNTYKLVGTGDIKRAWSKKEGADVVTTIQIRDGLRAFKNATLSRSYKAPVQPIRVLTDLAKSMGLNVPLIVKASKSLAQNLPIGYSVHGPSHESISKVISPHGYGWSIQDGQMQMLKDEELRPGELILVNQDNGLIGSPERSYPDKPGGKSDVKFETLLRADIKPGSPIRLQSEFLNTDLKATDVTCTGDTDSGDMKTSVTCKTSDGKAKKK